MSISRRAALNSIAAALGIAGTTATAQNTLATSGPSQSPAGGLEPKPFYSARSWPMLPCRVPDLMPEQAAEYERVFYWIVRENTYDAALGLESARAWYRQFPELVRSHDFPEKFAWPIRQRGEEIEASAPEFGPARTTFPEECRDFAEGYVRRMTSR